MQEVLDDPHQQEEHGNSQTANGKHTHERQRIGGGIPKNLLNRRKKINDPFTKTSKNLSNSSNHK